MPYVHQDHIEEPSRRYCRNRLPKLRNTTAHSQGTRDRTNMRYMTTRNTLASSRRIQSRRLCTSPRQAPIEAGVPPPHQHTTSHMSYHTAAQACRTDITTSELLANVVGRLGRGSRDQNKQTLVEQHMDPKSQQYRQRNGQNYYAQLQLYQWIRV